MTETIDQLKKILLAIEVEKDYADRLVSAGKKGRKYATLHEDELHQRQDLLRQIGSDIATTESLYSMYKRKSHRSVKFIVPKVCEIKVGVKDLT